MREAIEKYGISKQFRLGFIRRRVSLNCLVFAGNIAILAKDIQLATTKINLLEETVKINLH